MLAVRKIVLSVSALFLAFSGLLLANATAGAEHHTAGIMGCAGEEWNTTCP